MEAWVDVGEMDVPLIVLGQKARLDVDSFKDKKFTGIVTAIARSANNNDISTTASTSATGSTSTDATKFQVKIHIEDKEQFLPGMSVTANVETRYRTNVLSVPIQSVTTRPPSTNAASTNQSVADMSSNTPVATNFSTNSAPNQPAKLLNVVFVVEGDHVKMAPVKLGISDENYYEITDGLKEGQQIVSGGYKAINRDLADGKKIVVNKDAAALDKEAKAN
jgi:HlyD family secretion protein